MKKLNAILLSSTVAPLAFFNTNAGSKLYICATNQESNLSQGQFEALTWVQVKGVGEHGEVGNNTNILTYDTWDDETVQKAKGMTDAGSPEVELARNPTDPGQILMRTAAANNLNYAFKVERNDRNLVAGTPTILYNRGLVVGPRMPLGRNEDFDLEIFTLALQQKQVVVNPSAIGNPPLNTVIPAITGTAKVATLLTVSNGTWTGDATITYTYQWFAGGVLIPGATGNTYLPVTGDIGKIIQARVTGTNLSGNATASSAATAAVIP